MPLFHRILCLTTWVALIAGCAAPPTQQSPPAEEAALGDIGQSELSAAELLRTRLTNTDNGLELRRWTIVARPQRLIDALTRHADGRPVDDETLLRLKRNGFRLVRVPMERLDSLLSDLGGATVDANEWHGQVHDWRSLQDRPIDAVGRAVVIDGRVHRYERGEFRLLVRSWTVQMEDAPYVHLEMMPQHRRAEVNNLRQLLGQQRQMGEGFAAGALDLLLDSNYAYVLIGESPQVDYGAAIDGELAAAEARLARRAAASRPSRASRMGPFDAIGPEVTPPVTLGEVLLGAAAGSPTRDLLVFVPKIAADLFPPGQGPAPGLGPSSEVTARP